MSPFKTPEQHAAKLRSRIGPGPVPATYVLFVGDTVAGSVSLLNYDDIGAVRPDLSPWLSSLLVIPSQRSHGFGRALVEYCVDEARILRFRVLYLYTGTHKRFYGQLGWHGVEERTEGTVMKLELNP